MSNTAIEGENIEKKENSDKEKDEWINSILIAIVAAIIIRIFIFAPTIVVGPSMEPTLYGGRESSVSFFNFVNDRLIAERLSYFFRITPKRGDIVTFTAPNSEFYLEKNPFVKMLKFFTKREYIKRVIGIEGDHIEIKADKLTLDDVFTYDISEYEIQGNKLLINGKEVSKDHHTARMENASVYVNGKKLEENYTNGPWSVFFEINDGKITPMMTDYGQYVSGNVDINLDLTVPKGYIYVMGDNRNNSNDSRKFSPLINDYNTKDGCISMKEMSGRVILRFWPFNKFGTIKD